VVLHRRGGRRIGEQDVPGREERYPALDEFGGEDLPDFAVADEAEGEDSGIGNGRAPEGRVAVGGRERAVSDTG